MHVHGVEQSPRDPLPLIQIQNVNKEYYFYIIFSNVQPQN